jgi:NADH-quinone oxidoreductase subunit N
MTLPELLLMRHEWLLLFAVIGVLIADIGTPAHRKHIIGTLAITLTGVVTAIGFIPAATGSLFGGMYVTDPLRVLMKNILQVGVWLIFLQSVVWLRVPAMQNRISEFYILILSSALGACYLISSGHFLMFYLGLELLTLPTAAVAAFEYHRHQSAEAGIKLILSSAFASAILLFGISLLYATGSSLYFGSLTFVTSSLSITGLILLLSGLAFKISLVPFHLWTADVYEGSPTPNTAYLSVVSKGAAVFALVVIFFSAFRLAEDWWRPVFGVLAALTMTIGNLFALRQQDMKRFLAFSSVAQAGFIMLGAVQAGQLGTVTVVYFVLIYVFSNLAAFGVVLLAEQHAEKVSLQHFKGFYGTNPRLSLVMLLALFSLAGVPPLAGFFGKFFLFTAVAAKGYYVLLGVAVLNAVISLYYYLLVVKAMFIDETPNPMPRLTSTPYMQLALGICVAGILATGFYGGVYEYMNEVVTKWWYELTKI